MGFQSRWLSKEKWHGVFQFQHLHLVISVLSIGQPKSLLRPITKTPDQDITPLVRLKSDFTYQGLRRELRVRLNVRADESVVILGINVSDLNTLAHIACDTRLHTNILLQLLVQKP